MPIRRHCCRISVSNKRVVGVKLHEIAASPLVRRLQMPPAMKTSTGTRLAPVGALPQPGAGDARTSGRLNSAERHLLGRLRAGDESAFSEIVRRYHSALMRLALAFHPHRVFAEEVVQDTWTAVVDGLPSFKGQSSLKTWICRILTNRAKTRLVREARSVPLSALQNGDLDEPAVDATRFLADGRWAEPPQSFSEQSPERQLMRKEAIRLLERALQRLPLNQRAVVTLRDVEGLESEEICNILGVGRTNQRVLLHRGRSKLRRALEEYRPRYGLEVPRAARTRSSNA